VSRWSDESDGAREGKQPGSLGYTAPVLGYSDRAFGLLQDLIEKRTGLSYRGGKVDLLADRLAEAVSAAGSSSFLEYYYLLRYDPDAERHWARLLDRLSVPETYFWRQAEQLEAVANVVAPRHFAARGGPLRIWSAACCTGEEPLSIAMALAEAGLLDRHPIEIVASDASEKVIERARQGRFGERSFRALPIHLRQRYFTSSGDHWQVAKHLLERVRWTTANLIDAEQIGTLAAADVIFCRNVFIYFSDDAIRRVVHTFAERMPATGLLFVGASESLTRLSSEFKLEEVAGAFVYTRASAAGSATELVPVRAKPVVPPAGG